MRADLDSYAAGAEGNVLGPALGLGWAAMEGETVVGCGQWSTQIGTIPKTAHPHPRMSAALCIICTV